MIGLLLNDRYEIEAELGRGGMGIVYRARDILLERPVAVKVVSDTGLGSEGRARLLQEARAAARLNHPNIVAVHDAGQVALPDPNQDSSYIVMELVDGRSLRANEPKELDRVMDLAMDICRALDAAHQQGIIHRDLKPENVMVTGRGTVKLMDFGLARIAGQSRLTQEGTLMGTMSYLAPEVILGQEAGPAADLYALGVMLYEMSAGRHPFEADNLTAVLSQHLHAPVVPPSAYNDQISPALDRLIGRLLAKRPDDRPDSAATVLAALEEIGQPAYPLTAAALPSQLDRLVRGRMIGREPEFNRAAAVWREAAAGQGQLLLVSGEPGIGKTRLVRELGAYAEISGGRALVGRCYADEPAPYAPFAQMVAASLLDGAQLSLPQPVLATLRSLSLDLQIAFPDVIERERLDPEAERQRLFDSLFTWLTALTGRGPSLLVIEDVHWADSGSLALLRYLARRLDRLRLLIAATYREVELDEALPFQEALRELNRERLVRRIKLSRLTREQTGDLLATLFAEEIAPDFLDGIYGEAEGNPFFVEELCKTLVDSGRLYFQDGRWHRPADVADLEIPQGIRLTIQSRLARLAEEEQSLLQTAALLGRDFDYDMLAAVNEQDDEQLIVTLEKAERQQLIEELPRPGRSATPRFNFTHALIQSTLLANLSTLRRLRLQKQVALALEKQFPGRRKELAPLLGRYFAEAGDGEKGVEYLLLAGDAARELFAYDEAIKAYEEAMLFLNESGDHERAARTLMKLGLLYHTIFDFDSASTAFEQGFAEWQLAVISGVTAVPSPAPHPFRFTYPWSPRTLDPGLTNEEQTGWVITQLFSGLLGLNDDYELVPDVARSWEVLDGGRTYLFHLRRDVLWSDGRPVTAGDFEYGWKRCLSPDNRRGLVQLLYDIAGAAAFHAGQLNDPEAIGVKAMGDYTLRVQLDEPCSYFLHLMSHPASRPLPRHVVKRYGPAWIEPDKIVTNGPFLLSEWRPDQGFTLTRNPHYHGDFKGNVSEVSCFIATGTEAFDLYDRDDIDYLVPYLYAEYQDSRRFIHNHASDFVTRPGARTSTLQFNLRKPPFDDRRVRRSLVMAIDRDGLANRVAQGATLPAHGGLVPPAVAGHVPGIALPYDPAAARQALAEAGFPGGRGLPPLKGSCVLLAEPLIMLEALVAGWQEQLGLRIVIEPSADFRAFFRQRDEDPADLWLGGWLADYLDADSFLRAGVGHSNPDWHDQEFEALVEAARHFSDQERRLAMYRRAEQILVDEAAVVPLSYGRVNILMKPWLVAQPGIYGIKEVKDVVIRPH